MTPRYLDLLKQGFCKQVRPKKPHKVPVIVACERCQDWHAKGKHRKRVVAP